MNGKKILITIALLIINLLALSGLYAIEVEGEVSGIWTIDDSPISVVDTIFISAEDTLTIEPGVLVEFAGPYALLVHGKLFAEGAEDDSIVFHPDEDNEFWCGVRSDSGAVINLNYCVFTDCIIGDEDNQIEGSALFCQGTELVVTYSSFSDNLCYHWGGAIYIDSCPSVDVKKCIFNGNSSRNGGALGIWYTEDARIVENLFSENYASGLGGAIYTRYIEGEEFTISENIFCGNRSDYGGALWIGYLCPGDVHYNLFSRNSASSEGGAVFFEYRCFAGFFSNTVVENESERGGGLFQDAESYSWISDCIIWGNSADEGSQMYYYDDFDDGYLSFCNVEGGWPDSLSDHVINEDPLFVDPDNDDYRLSEDSPCIDAGNPETELDPDGTRADIGAFFFPQQNIAVEPDSLEFTGIQTGLSDSVYVTIHNIGLDTLRVDSLFITQEGDVFSLNPDEDEFFLEPDSNQTVWIIFSPFEQAEYEALLTIASNDRDQGELEIPIIASALSVSDEPNILNEFTLYEAYPNPFNASTRIRFDLADPGHVNVIIFDQLGRKVKTLCNNQLDAGRYTYSWKGIDDNGVLVNSGAYFCRVSTGSENEIIKMVVIK
jgi:predicted outer membrane repeat protein